MTWREKLDLGRTESSDRSDKSLGVRDTSPLLSVLSPVSKRRENTFLATPISAPAAIPNFSLDRSQKTEAPQETPGNKHSERGDKSDKSLGGERAPSVSSERLLDTADKSQAAERQGPPAVGADEAGSIPPPARGLGAFGEDLAALLCIHPLSSEALFFEHARRRGIPRSDTQRFLAGGVKARLVAREKINGGVAYSWLGAPVEARAVSRSELPRPDLLLGALYPGQTRRAA